MTSIVNERMCRTVRIGHWYRPGCLGAKQETELHPIGGGTSFIRFWWPDVSLPFSCKG